MRYHNKGDNNDFGLVLDSNTARFLKQIGLIPHITSGYAYVLALSIPLVLLISQSAWRDIYAALTANIYLTIGVLVILYLGIVRGIFYVACLLFLPQKCSHKNKRTIVQFVIVSYILLSTIIGIHIAATGYASWGLIVLVVWHFFQAALLLALLQSNDPDAQKNITLDEMSTKSQLWMGFAVIAAVLIVATYVLEVYWAISLSLIIIVYGILENALFKKRSNNTLISDQNNSPSR